MKEENTPKIDHDGNWKLLIDNLPFHFIAFFLPEFYPEIDQNVPPVFLDKEFHQIMQDLQTGKTIKDLSLIHI